MHTSTRVCGVATASTCNVVLMRYNELYEGIEVVNENEQVIGTSRAAGLKVCLLLLSELTYIKSLHRNVKKTTGIFRWRRLLQQLLA